MAGNFVESELTVVSFNMHGYNQGQITVKDLIESNSPDIIMLQEHWLTPANLVKITTDFPDYHAFGSSAMDKSVEKGPLLGRPFGGTMILVKNELLHVSLCVDVSERYVVVKVGDLLCVTVYLPCVGTTDRQLVCTDIFDNILHWRSQYPDCGCIIGGDFNTDLDSRCAASNNINKFLHDNNFCRSDVLFVNGIKFTYINEALNQYSKIDYIVYDNVNISGFEITDPDVNFSDHVPIIAKCVVNVECVRSDSKARAAAAADRSITRLRWDRADLSAYYNYTGNYLQPILAQLADIEKDAAKYNDVSLIDVMYDKIIDALQTCTAATVPSCKQNFFKFWWNQELDCLKERSIESHKLWKAAGRPRAGPIFDRRTKDRCAYRLAIKKNQSDSTEFYSNELHEALLSKQGNNFWKCWNSKFAKKSAACRQVDGLVEPQQIADNFANHFSKSCSNLTPGGAAKLTSQYRDERADYIGAPHLEEYNFDAELVENVISSMKRGKAACFDSLTAEHLQHCHPLLPGVLAKLFNWMLQVGYVPAQFGLSYTVPLLKGNTCSKNLSVDDFRGISISPVLSKVFEHCILQRFDTFFGTSDNQFGFKKSVGCSHAIYTARCVVDNYVSRGSTVNLCALDISKAFDRMNHHGLFLKLMHRSVPRTVLCVLENWFDKCFTCVKWNSVFSDMFKLNCGIRQGGVLSPYMFAIYIDDIVHKVETAGTGCYLGLICFSIFLYADDMLLLAPSISSLQKLFTVCETELRELDLCINAKKSVCTRIGPQCNVECCNIVTFDGKCLEWVDSLRYLGIFIIRAKSFRCCFDSAKRSFYRSFNAVYGKIGRSASEEVVLSLIKFKCLPCLLYGLEACPINKTEARSLDFPVTRILMKIFHTINNDVIRECQLNFGFPPVHTLVEERKVRFLHKYIETESLLCCCFAKIADQQITELHQTA